MRFTADVQGVPQTLAAFNKIETGITDFRQGAVWLRVQQAFYRILKEIFASEGGAGRSGKWKPLTSKYAAIKQKRYGDLPILQRSKRLYRSLTQQGGDAIVDKQALEMTLGSSVPYGGYHQKGTRKTPARPMIDLTEDHAKQLMEPVHLRMRQLAENARLRDSRGF